MKDDRDDRRDPDRRDREELDERVAELEARVRELRDELGEPPRGPLGLPRPPTPGEVLSFTGEYAIPTAIAVLEANVRALQALRQVIRVLDPERSAVGEERDRLENRAADASRATLDRLEDALGDVETVVRESDLPREGEARDILEDARRINRDIRDRVERSRREADETRERERGRGRDDTDRNDTDRDDADRGRDFEARSTTIEVTDADEDAGEDDDPEDLGQVDVDAELRSIKDELESREVEGRGTEGREEQSSEEDDSETESDEGEGGDGDDARGSHHDSDSKETQNPDDGDDRES